MHEPPNFIKSEYNLISNGKISRETSKSYNPEEEGGFLLEEVFLGRINDNNYPLSLEKFNLKEEIVINNKMIKQKRIDLITALIILDQTILMKKIYCISENLFLKLKKMI